MDDPEKERLVKLVRALMHRNRLLSGALHSLASHFGGEIGRTIVATLYKAEDDARAFERGLNAETRGWTMDELKPH